MRTFQQFIESRADIVDPKRNPASSPWERIASTDPADDDYSQKDIDDSQFFDDEEDLQRSSLGKLYTDEPMSHKELDFIGKLLDQEYASFTK